MTHSLSHLNQINYKYQLKRFYGIVLHTFLNTNIHNWKQTLIDNITHQLWTAWPKKFLAYKTWNIYCVSNHVRLTCLLSYHWAHYQLFLFHLVKFPFLYWVSELSAYSCVSSHGCLLILGALAVMVLESMFMAELRNTAIRCVECFVLK